MQSFVNIIIRALEPRLVSLSVVRYRYNYTLCKHSQVIQYVRIPDDRAQDEDVSECSYHRHNPVEDEEAGLYLGHKDEGLLCVARFKSAVLGAGVVHLSLAVVTYLWRTLQNIVYILTEVLNKLTLQSLLCEDVKRIRVCQAPDFGVDLYTYTRARHSLS